MTKLNITHTPTKKGIAIINTIGRFAAHSSQPQLSSNPRKVSQTQLSFESLGLPSHILRAVSSLGWGFPTSIQSAAISHILQGRDVLALAQTGTGKTAAFALPILSRIVPGGQRPSALVLSPTRELALQVTQAFAEFATHIPNLRLLSVYGGGKYAAQFAALKRGVDIVVGTPGRIIDHLTRGSLDLGEIKHLVLDEADEMLKMGFVEDVGTILAKTPHDKQVCLFSATMPKQIKAIADQYLKNAYEIAIQANETTAANISQHYIVVEQSAKLQALEHLLEVLDFDGMIVFVRTKAQTESLASQLQSHGYSAEGINGDIQQSMRETIISKLKNGTINILIATDVAARGLDVPRVDCVCNFDAPTDVESYIHRIGRTGRAGRSGASITFITPYEKRLLRSIAQVTGRSPAPMQLPTPIEINTSRLTRFDARITSALQQTKRIAEFAPIIDHYITRFGADARDVAAALALIAHGDGPFLLDTSSEKPQKSKNKNAAGTGTNPRTKGIKRIRGKADTRHRGKRRKGADRGTRSAAIAQAEGKAKRRSVLRDSTKRKSGLLPPAKRKKPQRRRNESENQVSSRAK